MTTKPEAHWIPVMPLGDLRLMNYKIPAKLAEAPDGHSYALSEEGARWMTHRILLRWRISFEDAEAFMATVSDEVMSDVIAIWIYLRVLLPTMDPAVYVHVANRAFEERTPWKVILDGDSLRLRHYLYDCVFVGFS